MAETPVLSPVVSFVNDASAVTTVNANSILITTAFADCLSLAGTTPNAMLSNLDMNNFQIINLPAPSTLNSPVRIVDALNPSVTVPPVGTSGHTVPFLDGINTWSDIGNNTFNGITSFTRDIFITP